MKSRLLGAVCACFLAGEGESAIVRVDAEEFPRGSIVNNSISGLTLSPVGTEPLLTGETIISDKPGKNFLGNTDFVFGYTQTNGIWDGGYIQQRTELRIDFDKHTDFSAALFASGNGVSAFIGVLRAFSSSATLLEEAITPLTGRLDTAWATISRPSADISYIQATGYGGTIASVDALQYNTVPIPPTAWLLGSALIGLAGIARRSAT